MDQTWRGTEAVELVDGDEMKIGGKKERNLNADVGTTV